MRNVALVGHSKAGKTTLAEAMLLASGAISRLGRVEDGSTVSDFDPEEHAHSYSIGTSMLTLEWDGHRINLLDTPGYADFEGEVVSAMAAADTAIIAVDAASGIEGGTHTAWDAANRAGVAARMFVITRIDREHADVGAVMQSLRDAFGMRVVPTAWPTEAEGCAVASLLHMEQAPSDGPIAEAREMLLEALAETDDTLLERYLDGEEITAPEIASTLCAATRSGQVVPVLPVCGPQAVGVTDLLSRICELGAFASEDAIAEQPAIVQVVKTANDPFIGHISFVRILAGTLRQGDQIRNQRAQADERAAHLFLLRGKEQIEVTELGPGEIGAIPRLSQTHTGDILAAPGADLEGVMARPLAFPVPTYRSALHPRSRDDLDKMSQALQKVLEQDPTLALDRGVGTGEMVLLTLGDVHASIVASRLQREYGVAVDVMEPRVPYCETVRGSVQTEYRHKKQTGGRGQFGHVVIRVEPLPRGAGFEFADEVSGGHVPRQYIPAVEQGVIEALSDGPLTHSRLVDLKVTLLDGSAHSVDSSEFAFKIAAAQALHQAVQQADPVLLEPIVHLHIEAPSDLTGDIAGEVTGRRGSVLGFASGQDTTAVDAMAPLAEVQRIAPQLRSLTHGRVRFDLEFDHLQEVPAHVQERVLADRETVAAR